MIQNSRLRGLPNGCYPSKCCVWCNQQCVVPGIIHFYQTIRNPFCFQWLGCIELHMIICWNTSLQPAIHLVLLWSRGWQYPLQPNVSQCCVSINPFHVSAVFRCAPWDLCRWVPGEAGEARIARCHWRSSVISSEIKLGSGQPYVIHTKCVGRRNKFLDILWSYNGGIEH